MKDENGYTSSEFGMSWLTGAEMLPCLPPSSTVETAGSFLLTNDDWLLQTINALFDFFDGIIPACCHAFGLIPVCLYCGGNRIQNLIFRVSFKLEICACEALKIPEIRNKPQKHKCSSTLWNFYTDEQHITRRA